MRSSKALLSVVRAFVRRAGIRVDLVGGAVRDSLLKRPVSDFDFAVERGEEDLARAFASGGWGKAFRLSSESSPFPVWRVSGSGVTIDVARFERPGGIAEDLARRDFTVNAMAIDVATGSILDPFGGRRDLARGIVRAVSERNLIDDPLRIVRAFRFSASRGWRFARSLRPMIRRNAASIATVSPDRIHAELVSWLSARRAAKSWMEAEALDVLNTLFPLPRASHGAARSILPMDRLRRRTPAESVAGRLAIYFHRLGFPPKDAAVRLADLKFSRREIRAVVVRMDLLAAISGSGDPRRLLFRFRRDWLELNRFLPDTSRRAGIAVKGARLKRLARKCRFGPPPFDGNDVAGWLRISSGPRLGAALEEASFRYFIRQWRVSALQKSFSGIDLDATVR